MVEKITQLVNDFGFPVIAVAGLGYFVYYIWNWVTTEIKPMIEETIGIVIGLIDKVRMLDNDMIRLMIKMKMIIQDKAASRRQSDKYNNK
jgi:hypothetical protein